MSVNRSSSNAMVAPRCSALPSVEKAREALALTRSGSEVRKIRAIAQAVATVERGKEIAIDAAEIILLADVRIGELTREMETGAGRPEKISSKVERITKAGRLDSEGISKRHAWTCERIASLPTEDLSDYVAASRALGQSPTTEGAVRLAKLTQPQRSKALAKFEEDGNLSKAIGAVAPKVASPHVDDYDEDELLDPVFESVRAALANWRGPDLRALLAALDILTKETKAEYDHRN